MRHVTWRSPLLAILKAGLCILTAGCGDLASQALKTGIYNYIGGSLQDGLISAQLRDFINGLLTNGLKAFG